MKINDYSSNRRKNQKSVILSVIDILIAGHSSKETYHQIKKLEEKKLIIIRNNSSFKDVYDKLLVLTKVHF